MDATDKYSIGKALGETMRKAKRIYSRENSLWDVPGCYFADLLIQELEFLGYRIVPLRELHGDSVDPDCQSTDSP